MDSLLKMEPKDVVVIRGGRHETLQPPQLVPGDTCELTTGMALPADLRAVGCTPARWTTCRWRANLTR